MSGLVTEALGELVAEFQAAGIPATSDPDVIHGIVSGAGLCALIAVPAARLMGLGKRLDLEIPVNVACNPPGGYSDWLPVWEALPKILEICGKAEARPIALNIAGGPVLPAYRLTAIRSYDPSGG